MGKREGGEKGLEEDEGKRQGEGRRERREMEEGTTAT